MRRVLVLGALAALGLVACGGGDDDGENTEATGNADAGPGGDVDVDVCELLTTAEVEDAIGNPTNDGRPDIADSCAWDTDDPDLRNVSVHLLVGASQEQCVSALEGDDQLTAADGFGDPAFTSYNPVSGGLADVVACTEQGQLQVIVNGGLSESGNETALRTAAEDLAGSALARL